MILPLKLLCVVCLLGVATACGDNQARLPQSEQSGEPTQASPDDPIAAAAEDTVRPRCVLDTVLTAWIDTSRSLERYDVYLTLSAVAAEIASRPPPAAGEVTDTVAREALCRSAKRRQLAPFLTEYRRGTVPTGLAKAVTDSLAEAAVTIAALARAKVAPPVPPKVAVPRGWLLGLFALLAVIATLLWLGLRRLGKGADDYFRHLESRRQEGEVRQKKDLDSALKFTRDAFVTALAGTQEGAETAQLQTRAEMRLFLGRIQTELAMLREQLAENPLGNARGHGLEEPSRGGSDDAARDGLELMSNQLAMEWEEIPVDVRPTSGPTEVHSDSYGLFTLRWARGAEGQAKLSVDSSHVLGAGFRDKLDAAFSLKGGELRGTNHYRTVREANCTWDPTSRQGKIDRKGVVEEVG